MEDLLIKKTYPIVFTADKESPTTLNFKGYEGTYIDSKVTNGKRLFYDKNKPYTKKTTYYNNFKATKTINIPKAYILQQGWHKIIERLKNNSIKFTRFKSDTLINVATQHIANFDTRKSAYEGHYLHYNTTVKETLAVVKFKKGDIYISTQQKGIRYIIETLEAAATDSFFNWNFFDTILQQKEGFSSYVFEDVAEQFLKDNPKIKNEFDDKIKNDINFAKNTYAQLYYIYKKTPHYEKSHLKLPIYKKY
ncbi:hypothetical protein [Tenacibaculum retecalamus]|uniref:hypothetical protein n=1 Tax=Tenacibaculum retecalamus TaxID=3018315 RepID=UPI002FDEB786